MIFCTQASKIAIATGSLDPMNHVSEDVLQGHITGGYLFNKRDDLQCCR
jgi:hypothetical protein